MAKMLTTEEKEKSLREFAALQEDSDLIAQEIDICVRQEREACARIAKRHGSQEGAEIAAAIRARSKREK